MRDEFSAKGANYAPSRVIGLAALRDNYIWIVESPDESSAIVVDPGDALPVLDYLNRSGRCLAAVLVTHHHADHVAGLSDLQAQWPDVPVYGPEMENISGITHSLCSGITLTIAGLAFQVLDLSGHTLGHLGYVQGERLFCGDTLFGLGCGRLFEGSPKQMLASLDRIAALPPATEIYCAHEYTAMNLPFAAAIEPENRELAQRAKLIQDAKLLGQPTVPLSLQDELMTNPFLRCEQPEVVAAAQRFDTCVTTDRVAVFSALRTWRNEFKG